VPTVPETPPEIVWSEASERLRTSEAFGPLVAKVGPVRLRPPESDPFSALARAILYQQLATQAAATIHARFQARLAGQVTPERVLSTAEEALREAGLSRGKLRAIQDLAHRVDSGALDLEGLTGLADREVEEALTTVWGIGPWTAQMHLLFHLRRPDVWPVLDLGVRSGWARIHGLPAAPDAPALEALGEEFRPWRSAVAWYCWQAMRPDVASDLYSDTGI